MKTIALPAYGKINLSLDVLGKQTDGYHQVQMIMHQIVLHDTVTVSWNPGDDFSVHLSCTEDSLPTNQENIACRAAWMMYEAYGEERSGEIHIQIQKRIPVAAGLAGGSADGAAVILALSQLWELSTSLAELMALGAQLGADVPFCVMGQTAFGKRKLHLLEKQKVSACALAEGIGELLTPLPELDLQVLLSKPAIGVSTAQVYGGLQLDQIQRRPNTEQLIQGLHQHNLYKITKNMVNLLETVTLPQFPVVAEEKAAMETLGTAAAVLMSGSGPTIFGLHTNTKKAKLAYVLMKKRNTETYLTRTLVTE